MRTLREEIIACARTKVRALEADQGYELEFRFGEDFTGFNGHFPGHPVLPAFVQLLMGQCAVNIRGTCDWSLRRVERSKFLRTIRPNQPIVVRWREQPLKGSLRCGFTLLVHGEKAAVFTLELTSGENRDA